MQKDYLIFVNNSLISVIQFLLIVLAKIIAKISIITVNIYEVLPIV